MPGESVNWLLVGTGDIVRKRVAAALSLARKSHIVGICAQNRDRARTLADELGVADVFTDYEEALQKADADAVYLATPVNLHIPQAVAAIEAGKHVLVEKPLGLNASECRRAVLKAAAAGVIAGCAYYRRFFPRFEHARRMLESGTFGQIVLIRMDYRSWYRPAQDDPKRWRLDKSVSGGGPLADMGCHMIDQLIGLVGMPERVFAKVDNFVHAGNVEDSASVLMSLPGGGNVFANFQWNSKQWSHEFEIAGAEAGLKWSPADSGKVLKTVGRDVEELDLPNADNVHLPLVEDFVDAVLNSRPPRIGLGEARKTNVVIDAIYESGRTGKEIEL